jgi:calcium/calmodulin-dependent protein kinase (CaM kinase) II
MTRPSDTDELLTLTERLLESIGRRDWETYEQLCDPELTAFEPEARGVLVHGLAFHRFYFEQAAGSGPQHTTLCDPHVRLLGDVAVVSYIRLVQRLGEGGKPQTERFEETRVWHRRAGAWRHVHFHRSAGLP